MTAVHAEALRVPMRVQRRRTKGWRMPDGAIYVGRPSKWGNPWAIGKDGLAAGPGMFFSADPDTTRQFVVTLFSSWMQLGDQAPALSAGRRYPTLQMRRDRLVAALPLIRGHDLACWCPLDSPCHADILLQLANGDLT